MPFDSKTASEAGSKSSRKGTPNKDTRMLREKVNQLLDDQWENVAADLKKLSAKERLDIYVRLLEYGLPKLSRTEVREVATLEEFIAMSTQERQKMIMKLKKQIGEES